MNENERTRYASWLAEQPEHVSRFLADPGPHPISTFGGAGRVELTHCTTRRPDGTCDCEWQSGADA